MNSALFPSNLQHPPARPLSDAPAGSSRSILRGRLLKQPVEPVDWLHFMLALLPHDIGYVRDACPGDKSDRFVIDEAGETINLQRGASDAALAPYHVDRSKIIVRARFESTRTSMLIELRAPSS